MKLSQCMIVKNEEKNIRRALSWGKGIVCEQIVVDTGSTDRTAEIAKEMGAKVFHFEWINDFAAAKNYAIRQAMGDWIAFLDADEYFLEEDASKIPVFLERIENQKKDRNHEKGNAILCTMTHLGVNGKIIRIGKQARLFRNKSYIKYQGKIHEQIADTRGNDLILVDLLNDLNIYHTGYMWTEELREEKGKRNLEPLLQEIKEQPENAMIRLYAAESLSLVKRYRETMEHVTEAIKNVDGSVPKDRLLAAYQLQLYTLFEGRGELDISEEDVLSLYRQACDFDNTCPDFDIAIGFWYYAKKGWEKAKDYLEAAIHKAENENSLDNSRIIAYIKEIYRMLAECSNHLEDRAEIIKYGTIFLQLEKYREGVLIPILNQFLNVEHEPVERVEEYLKSLYDFQNRKDLYFLLKHTRLAGFLELEEALKRHLTEEERIKIYGA